MSILTNKTKENITSVVMTLIMLMVFSASAMAQNVIYVLTNELTPGEEYLIVSRNNNGTGYALQRDETDDVTRDQVTVNQGGNVATNYYISNSTVNANSVWTVGGSVNKYTFQNDGYYLEARNGIGRSIRVRSSLNDDCYWVWETDNKLWYDGSWLDWYIYYSSGLFASNDFEFSNSSNTYVYLYKKVRIIANPSSLTLTTKVGEPVTATFTVKCPHLKGNITATLTDDTGYFSIDKTSVAASADGQTITVTFLPLETGTFENAYITLSSNYAESVRVNITGIANTATDYYPVTVSKYGYTTLYFNQPLVIPYKDYNSSGNQLKDVSFVSAASSPVAMTKLMTLIPANTGVVIEGTANKTFNFPYYKGTAPAAITGNKLTGSMNDISPSDALAGHSSTSIIMTLSPHPDDKDKPSPRIGFYKFVGPTLTGKKAYLIYDTAANNGVNFLSINGMEEEAAGISNVNARIDDGAWYTLQGVRLNGAPKQRGIYIRNGKTVVVK